MGLLAFGAEEAGGDAGHLIAMIPDTFHAVAVAGAVPGAGTVLGEDGYGLGFHGFFLSMAHDVLRLLGSEARAFGQ